MALARPVTPAPWTRPGKPRIAGRPSWIGMLEQSASPSRAASVAPPTRSGSIPPPLRSGSIPPPPGVPSIALDSSIHRTGQSSHPSSLGAMSSLAHASGAPSPMIQSEREVELESEIIALREELGRMAVDLASVRARVIEESEPEIVRLALTVAERVVGRELSSDPTLVVTWVKEGMLALRNRKDVVVAVASDLASSVPPEALAEHKVFVDEALKPGTCELRDGSSVVPVSAADRIAAMSDALGVDGER
jgi:hypothetical protein